MSDNGRPVASTAREKRAPKEGPMTTQHESPPQLMMERNRLDDLPALLLPEGFRIVSMTAGREKDWERIVAATFQWNTAFQQEIASNPVYTPDRVLFVLHGDQAVGTATAWHKPLCPPGTGYLHMVGVLPEYSGRSLGYAISLAALEVMRAHGDSRAILHTDDFRLPAIRAYLKLGFEPVIDSEAMRERWKAVFAALGM